MNTQPFSQTGQMIELCCEYLSVRCIWLYVIIMSRTSFRVNPHSIVCLNVKELLAWSRRHIWSLSDSNGIRTHTHLVRKRTLNHLTKPTKWLSSVVSTYLHTGLFFGVANSEFGRGPRWSSPKFAGACFFLKKNYEEIF